jgi:hypothetical protein
MQRKIDPSRLGEDWEGNNIAVTCPNPKCHKIFIVSARMHPKGRLCPKCGESQGVVSASGGRESGGTAYIIWPLEDFMADETLKPEVTGRIGGTGAPLFAKCPLCRKTFSLPSDGSLETNMQTLNMLFRQHMLEKHFAKGTSRRD